jgi:pimeloyl-ACP methyl ester carboxylesterase
MFKNEGIHTPSNTLADAVAALDYLQNAGLEFVAQGHFAVIGYSYGGWVALLTGARDPRVSCVAGIGPGNVGVLAEDMNRDPKVRAYWEDYLEKIMRGDPARGIGGKQTVEEILAHSSEFDIRNQGETLSRKPVLLIGGWRDQTASLEKYTLPIARAVEAVDGSNLTPIVLDDDHDYRKTREEVHAAVCNWLRDKCRPIPQH